MQDTHSSTPPLPLVRDKAAPLDPPPEYARLRTDEPITRVSTGRHRLQGHLLRLWRAHSSLMWPVTW
jgi:hypothetical protein